MQNHIEICEYREVQCTQCGQYIQQLVLTRHKETDCPMRPELLVCPHCREEVPSQQMQVGDYGGITNILFLAPVGCHHEHIEPLKAVIMRVHIHVNDKFIL